MKGLGVEGGLLPACKRLQTRCPAGARKKGGDRIEVATLLSIGDVQLNAL